MSGTRSKMLREEPPITTADESVNVRSHLDVGSARNVSEADDWLDTFEHQATDALYEHATRYASTLAGRLAHVDARADHQYAQELVQAAIVDTLIGVVVWDPAVCSLEAHVIKTIKSRCSHDRERAVAAPHVPIDASDDALHLADTQRSEALEAETEARQSGLCLSWLREIAVSRRDNDVLLVLECFQEGHIAPRDVILKTGWRANRWRNAKHRLASYVEMLPAPRVSSE